MRKLISSCPSLSKLGQLILMIACAMSMSCHRIDDDRIPPAAVYIPFNTIGEWQLYGVAGAMDYRYFIKEDKSPQGYPYSALAATGFGGILLACEVTGNPVAYDLACPVEARNNVRIKVVKDQVYAECPVCHSTYNVFISPFGYPLSGKAAEYGYGLRQYVVMPGRINEYMVVSR